MGISQSKSNTERCEALRLCKERLKFIKKAIDSRYDFAAAHLAYLESLRDMGTALRRYAAEEDDEEGIEKTPSPPPPVSRASYMRSGGTNAAVTVSLNPSAIEINTRVYDYAAADDYVDFTMPPPPPPPPPSWDYFDGNFNDRSSVHKEFNVPEPAAKKDDDDDDNSVNSVVSAAAAEPNKDSCLTEGEREEELITHRAKDFLSSIKEIENRFFQASESGNEVSRMLEVDKIRVGYSESKGGGSTSSALLWGNCGKGKITHVSHGICNRLLGFVYQLKSLNFVFSLVDVANIITWKRSTSLHSSSSRNHLAQRTKDVIDGNGSDFIEDFCMVAGSHSSTLDRLYAWERKLYDEVKTSESIRKVYDRKCDQLRNQFAKDLKTHVIDKTRALVKDLHSRIIVALHTVDSISKRIEKMRDEELQPQLLELIQGLNRMWKAMLECHHAQYITSSLAYYLKKSKTGNHQEETKKQIMDELQHKIGCFGLSFAGMVNSQTSYVESINNWLQNCIIHPKERMKRRPFSPRRSVAPPIFVICRDWSAGIQALPSQQLSDSIKALLSHLPQHLVNELDQKQSALNGEEHNGGETQNDDVKLRSIHLSLTKVLDWLTKFSESSLKMYEDIKQKSETAQNVYSNYRPPARAFSI
ncbi:hypothetical protein SSX86_016506 [Deinandra increscens subsp. villosa]|uniref:Uncharacterized protein n=1 Tax=Deinandra increscens subsp. villosa TaxID=3103831 RepID=A0AAP0D5L1_9ASTR